MNVLRPFRNVNGQCAENVYERLKGKPSLIRALELRSIAYNDMNRMEQPVTTGKSAVEF